MRCSTERSTIVTRCGDVTSYRPQRIAAFSALWLGGALLAETDRFLEWERHQPVVVDAPTA